MPIPTAEALRDRINAHGNNYKLAMESGVARTTIIHIAEGRTANPGIETVRALVEALDELEGAAKAGEVARG